MTTVVFTNPEWSFVATLVISLILGFVVLYFQSQSNSTKLKEVKQNERRNSAPTQVD